MKNFGSPNLQSLKWNNHVLTHTRAHATCMRAHHSLCFLIQCALSKVCLFGTKFSSNQILFYYYKKLTCQKQNKDLNCHGIMTWKEGTYYWNQSELNSSWSKQTCSVVQFRSITDACHSFTTPGKKIPFFCCIWWVISFSQDSWCKVFLYWAASTERLLRFSSACDLSNSKRWIFSWRVFRAAIRATEQFNNDKWSLNNGSVHCSVATAFIFSVLNHKNYNDSPPTVSIMK